MKNINILKVIIIIAIITNTILLIRLGIVTSGIEYRTTLNYDIITALRLRDSLIMTIGGLNVFFVAIASIPLFRILKSKRDDEK